ncbi:MAG: UDP-N-acetylmuramate dehydrogenase [Bacteroidales bacterium]|nr:UDP-N-acetylmuramate dehydrogenase [Bacteroidales bacterium]
MIKQNVSLLAYNTFKIDATAKVLAIIENLPDLETLCNPPYSTIFPRLFMGGGSNLLFTHNYEGIIVHSQIKGIEKVFESESETWLKAGSGIIWDDFVAYCVKLGLGGVENLSDIPGCVGSAPVQNIGAYGMEAKDTIVEVQCHNLATNETLVLKNSECQFGYRDSIFKTPGFRNCFITHVTFCLKKQYEAVSHYGTIEQELEKFADRSVRSVRRAVINIRRNKLPPAELGSAGSFFKNPVVGNEKYAALLENYPEMPVYKLTEGEYKIPAAWLIEKAGLKGIKHNNAGTYIKQPLVIVNYGKASGKEIADFSYFIRQKVYEQFKIMLEPEVNFV